MSGIPLEFQKNTEHKQSYLNYTFMSANKILWTVPALNSFSGEIMFYCRGQVTPISPWAAFNELE